LTLFGYVINHNETIDLTLKNVLKIAVKIVIETSKNYETFVLQLYHNTSAAAVIEKNRFLFLLG